MSFFTDRSSRAGNVVLIADDDLFIRTILRKILDVKTTVIETRTGKDVCELYQKHNPDIVILDVYLPDLSGWDALDQLCTLDPSVFIMMTSGDRTEENRVRAIRSGAQGFFGKPFDPETVLYYLTRCPTFRFSDSMIKPIAPPDKK